MTLDEVRQRAVADALGRYKCADDEPTEARPKRRILGMAGTALGGLYDTLGLGAPLDGAALGGGLGRAVDDVNAPTEMTPHQRVARNAIAGALIGGGAGGIFHPTSGLQGNLIGAALGAAAGGLGTKFHQADQASKLTPEVLAALSSEHATKSANLNVGDALHTLGEGAKSVGRTVALGHQNINLQGGLQAGARRYSQLAGREPMRQAAMTAGGLGAAALGGAGLTIVATNRGQPAPPKVAEQALADACRLYKIAGPFSQMAGKAIQGAGNYLAHNTGSALKGINAVGGALNKGAIGAGIGAVGGALNAGEGHRLSGAAKGGLIGGATGAAFGGVQGYRSASNALASGIGTKALAQGAQMGQTMAARGGQMMAGAR